MAAGGKRFRQELNASIEDEDMSGSETEENTIPASQEWTSSASRSFMSGTSKQLDDQPAAEIEIVHAKLDPTGNYNLLLDYRNDTIFISLLSKVDRVFSVKT